MNNAIISYSIVILIGIFFCNCQKQRKVSIFNYNSEFIFTDSITQSCHAATIVELENHNLLTAWFGGTYEGAKDVGIYSSVFKENKWSKPTCIIEPLIINEDTLPCWNPVLFKSNSHQLYLFYKVGKNPREWFGAMIKSSDNGISWSKAELLPKDILGPIKNKPIEIENGIILCGSSTEKSNGEWRVHVELFNEKENSWQKIPVQNTKDFDVIQPTFIELENKKIQMLCRSKHNKVICSMSEDMGKTWSDMDTIAVPNSNSGIDAVTVSNNLFLMVNNPLNHGKEWFNGRNRLDVEYSYNGENWEKIIDLENQDKGQFSYPAIIKSSDGLIHIVYTYNRKYIKHVSFKLGIIN